MRFLFILCICIIFSATVSAQTIIRDTEIEGMLRSWATPIFKAADLNPDSVNIILVQNDAVNAFVAGGQNIFLFTGLIEKSETPGELIGVIAHETGHISGGHLVRLRGAVEQASYEAILGTILGIGAAVLTGEGELAGAIISGTQNVVTRRFLANSRLNESSADQAGLTYMNEAGLDPEGLLSFLQKLEGDELLPPEQQTEYVRTHPLTGNRLSALETKVRQSPHAGQAAPAGWIEDFARMKAKLRGFINPQQVQWQYSSSDDSVAARYARAIAAYRTDQVDTALSLMNALIETEPENPFFQELKGQMLVDFGRVQEALPFYQKAVELQPKSGLIRTAYAHALIEVANRDNDPAKLQQAIQELETARQKERRSTRIYRLLATAYGRQGDEVSARLNLAEEALLQQRISDARRFATYVSDQAAEDSREKLRAQDILTFLSESDRE